MLIPDRRRRGRRFRSRNKSSVAHVRERGGRGMLRHSMSKRNWKDALRNSTAFWESGNSFQTVSFSNDQMITTSLHHGGLLPASAILLPRFLFAASHPSAHQKFKALRFAVLYLVLVWREWKDRALMTVYEPRSHTPFLQDVFLQLTYPTCG